MYQTNEKPENQHLDNPLAYAQQNYLHESPELIKCNVDSIKNKKIICYWISFFTIILVLYLCTLALPSATKRLENTTLLNQCSDSKFLGSTQFSPLCISFSYLNNPSFGGIIHDVKNMNQFILINLIFNRSSSNVGFKFEQKIKFTFSLLGLNKNMQIKEQLVNEREHSFNLYCDASSETCDEVNIAYISQIKFPNYAFMVTFDSDDATTLKLYTDKFDYFFYVVNGKYTSYLIALRYVFLILSFITFSLYYVQLKKLESFHWILEQKMTLYLSGLVVLFNDPFYALTILVPNFASAFFSVLFIVNFVTFFIIYIVTIFHRIHKENGQKKSKVFDKWKFGFGILIWFLLMYTYVYLSFQHLKDPATSYETDLKGFTLFIKIMLFIVFSIYLVFILYLYYAICKQYATKIWRNKLFVIFEIYFILCLALFIYSGTFKVYQSIGNRVLLSISLMNLQVFYLQFIYAPSPEGLKQATQLRTIEDKNVQIYEQLDESIHQIDIQFDHSNANINNNNQNNGQNQNHSSENQQQVDNNILIELSQQGQNKTNQPQKQYEEVKSDLQENDQNNHQIDQQSNQNSSQPQIQNSLNQVNNNQDNVQVKDQIQIDDG